MWHIGTCLERITVLECVKVRNCAHGGYKHRQKHQGHQRRPAAMPGTRCGGHIELMGPAVCWKCAFLRLRCWKLEFSIFLDDRFPWTGIAGITGITVHAWLVQACLQSAVARIQNSQVRVANVLLLKIYENLLPARYLAPRICKCEFHMGKICIMEWVKMNARKSEARLTAWKEIWE